MGDQRFVYEVAIDAATAQAAAKQLSDVFKQELAKAESSAQQQAASREAAAAAKQAAKEAAAAAKQAEKEALAAARQAAKEKTAIAKQAAAEMAEAAREAAYVEASAAKQAAREVRVAQQELAQAYKREQKDKVVAARQAAKDIAAAERAAAQNTLGARLGRGATSLLTLGTGGLGGLAALGLGGMAAYGAIQGAQRLYGMGSEGAEMERTALLYETVTARMKVSARGLVQAMQEASRGVLTESQAQSLGLQILSQKWANTRTDIVGDAATLTAASRRFAMIYPDSEGRAQSSNEVAAKLLSYIREGNKELVDQFNITNASIAKAAGVPNENLTSADRARGLFKILEEEIARLPDTMNTSVEQIQQAEAEFSDAMDRIKRALAGPTAAAASGAADFLEGYQRGTVTRDPNGRFTPEQMRTIANEAAQMQRQEPPKTWGGADVQAQRLEEYRKAVEAIADAQAKGYGPANAWADAIKAASSELDYFNVINDENAQAVALVNAAYAEEKPLIDSLADAHADAAAAAADEAAAVEQAGKALDTFMKRVGETNTQLLALARQMAAGMTLNIGMNVTANTVWQDAIDQYGKTLNVPGTGVVPLSPFAGTTVGENIRALGGNRTDLMPNPSAEARRQDMYDVWDVREERRREAEQAANKAAREWESAAKKAQTAFEKAAEDTAEAFKSSLESIPGLFGTSDVTEQDMKDAEAGIYKEKPDEYLRQLRDEVLNKKDYPGVDLADIASVAGVDQSLDPKAQLRLIERMWDDSSLFANPNALRFINKDAIAADMAQQDKSAQGKQNLLSWLGLDAESPLTPFQKDQYAKLIGMDTAEKPDYLPSEDDVKAAAQESKKVFVTEFAQPAPGGSQSQAFMDELLRGLDPTIIGGETADTLKALGTSIFGAIYSGYSSSASAADWPQPVVDGLVGQVLPAVLAAIEGDQ